MALALTLAACGGDQASDASAEAATGERRTALAAGGSGAGSETIYSEAGKLTRSEETVEPLGIELFGERVSLYSGALEFVQPDVSIPGNSKLPVSVARRLTTGTTMVVGGNFGDWDLEIPHVHGIFAASTGWTVGGTLPADANKRCSLYGAPPQVLGQSNQGTFNPEEYWHGSFLYVPGVGSKEILKRSAATPYPSDGNSYPLATNNQWVIRCLTSLQRGTGDGFVAVSPDGTQYRFDWMVTRPYSVLTRATQFPAAAGAGGGPNVKTLGVARLWAKPLATVVKPPDPTPNLFAGYLLQRNEVWVMPTQITDRFGNTVTYSYDSAYPWRVTAITGSDAAGSPRSLSLSYEPGSSRVSSITDGAGRVWTYTYRLATGNVPVLSTVTRPDLSAWTFNLDALTLTSGLSLGGGSCDGDMSLNTASATGTITHPSGATGTFVAAGTAHGRAGVERACRGNVTDGDWSLFPLYIDAFSIQSKTISGPGMANATWSYSYGPANASFAPCSGCVQTKTVTVTDPRSVATRYTFGNLFRVTEGQLLQIDEGWNGASAPRVTTLQYRSPAAGP